MPTWTFTKKSGAPAGLIEFSIGNDTFILDDTTNTSISTTNPNIAWELRDMPWIIQSGYSGTVPPTPLIEQIMLVNGIISKLGPSGTYLSVPIDGGASV